jgi:mono/diheme cytochrome c family protein
MSEQAFGVIGLFETPDALLAAIRRVKPKELGKLEAYTPYPVHGLEEALDLRRSPLGGMVLVMGILGTITAFLFQWWMNSVDYPLVTGGKDPSSWQAFVPIMIEVTVLFATFTAGLGALFLLNKLPALWHPLLLSKSAAAVTRDRFGLSIEARSGALEVAAAQAALKEAGAVAIEVLPRPAPPKPVALEALLALAAGGVLVCFLAAGATYWGVKLFPVLPPTSHMLEQPRLDAQKPSAFFKDGHGMRLPVAGTVARGHTPYPFETLEQARGLANPLPRTAAVMSAGKTVFSNKCLICHGPLANGVPILSDAYGAKPANLQSQKFLDYTDGEIYHTIVKGKNAMPSLAAAISPDERWEAIHYVRALQRAQHAKDSDLP